MPRSHSLAALLLPLTAALCTACAGSSSSDGASRSSASNSSSSSEPAPETCSAPARLIIDSASDDGTHDGHSPDNAIDGSLDSESRWSSMGDGKSLLLDLGTEATVTETRTAWLDSNTRTAFYDIEASSDNIHWSTLAANGQSQASGEFTTDSFDPIEARYVRLIGRGNAENSWNSLLEVEMYGCGGLEAPSVQPSGPPPQSELDPGKPPSENFDLSRWYISVPIDDDGNGRADNIKEDDLNEGYELPGYFFTGTDGGMVFRVYPAGFKTSTNTNYARVELREMLRAGNTRISTQGVNANNWVFGSAPVADREAAGGINGNMRATLAVNRVSTTGESYQIGRVIIGQIHANDDEPIRLYYRKLPNNPNGVLYFAHELKGGDDSWHELIGSRANSTPNPTDGIALDEMFSYEINVEGNSLSVFIYRDGKPTVRKAIDMIDSGYDEGGQYMYFKAGAYNQNNSGEDDDYAQVTFYALEHSHD